MLDYRPILLVIGYLITVLSIAMLIPAIVDLAVGNSDWSVFVFSSFITAFIGITLILTNQVKSPNLSIRQAFLLTTLSWVSLAAFAALPLKFSASDLGYIDAFFEAMSALTTTGATIMTDLESTAPGILLWRAILQWFGGIGIIVVAIAVLPMLRIGGMQLFRTESSDKNDKILPRAKNVSVALTTIYIFLTVICAFLLWLAGMTFFDAICHAMTTIATAGFSTHDASIAYFDSVYIEGIIAFFLILSSLPFVLYIRMLQGKHVDIFQDSQVRFFLLVWFMSVSFVVLWLHYHNDYSYYKAIRMGVFNVTSVITTTGYASADYSVWGSMPVTFLFILCVVGGCTGSTTGGIKIFRYQMLYEIAKAQLHQLVQPHGVFKPHFNNKQAGDAVTSSVMSFFILFAFCFLVLAIMLSFTGLDFLTSMSASAAVLANLGPGLGDVVGPAGNYASLSDFAKLSLSAGMLVGRLEIFTVLVLFSKYFWQD